MSGVSQFASETASLVDRELDRFLGGNVRIHMEFLGLSRFAAGVKEIALDLEEGTTFRDIVRLLGTRYPTMIGTVIQPDGKTLQAPNIFNRNAKRMIQPSEMDDSPTDGDRIILMSISAGG
jgi:molybdopterin converting factor small subunit